MSIEQKILYSNLIIADINLGKILLLKRSNIVPFQPAKWCFPGGHIEEYESPDEAALREAKEEMGVDFSDLTIYKVGLQSNAKALMYYFIVYIVDPTVLNICLDMQEHQQYTWVTPKQAMKLDLMLDLEDHISEMFKQVPTLKLI